MNHHSLSKPAAVFTGLAVVVAASVLWGQGRVDRQVVYSEENGQCILTTSPTRIRAKHNFVIVWRLVNDCSQEITINIGNFRLGTGPEEPLDISSSATVSAGNSGRIIGVVKGEAEPGTYLYDVSLEGGSNEDPELVIDP